MKLNEVEGSGKRKGLRRDEAMDALRGYLPDPKSEAAKKILLEGEKGGIHPMVVADNFIRYSWMESIYGEMRKKAAQDAITLLVISNMRIGYAESLAKALRDFGVFSQDEAKVAILKGVETMATVYGRVFVASDIVSRASEEFGITREDLANALNADLRGARRF